LATSLTDTAATGASSSCRDTSGYMVKRHSGRRGYKRIHRQRTVADGDTRSRHRNEDGDTRRYAVNTHIEGKGNKSREEQSNNPCSNHACPLMLCKEDAVVMNHLDYSMFFCVFDATKLQHNGGNTLGALVGFSNGSPRHLM
jgi:hypothetical protein